MSAAADIIAPETPTSRWGVAWPILRLGGPLIAYYFIQNTVGLGCLAIIGRLGDAALAGVGVANALYAAVLALLFGFDTGVQAMVSRAVGAGDPELAVAATRDGVAGSTIVGAVLAIVVWLWAPDLLARILPTAAAVEAGTAFLRAFAPSLLFLGITIPINAGWIARGEPAIAFAVTFGLAPVQVGLTFLLVLGAGPVPALGTVGAGLAGSLSCAAGVLIQLALAARRLPGFLRAWPSVSGLASVCAIGWPVSLQQSLLQFGFMAAYVIIARLGEASAAAANVLANLTMLPTQCAVGLGVAAATLVGQAMGRGDVGEARRWGWRTSWAAAWLTAPVGLAAMLAPRAMLGLFLHHASTADIAVLPLQLLGASLAFGAVGQVLGFALRGAGATKWAAGVPFASQWLAQLPLMWLLGVTFGMGILGVAVVQAGLAGLDTAILAWVWVGSSWTRVRIGREVA
jgi:putative MATE family efflux protein